MKHYFKGGAGGRPEVVGAWIRGVPLRFLVPRGLFSSERVDKGTLLLAEFMDIPSEGKALDLGCGYGVLGILMAKLNNNLKVYMVDVNPVAVDAAKRNAKLNGVEVEVLQGDLYSATDALGIRDFSTIVSNPPLSAGKEVVRRIIEGAPERLRKGGSLQMVMAQGGDWARELAEGLFSEVIYKRKKGYALLKAYL